jgi:SAM-dependent methyltransferase
MDARERLTVSEAQAPTLLGTMHVHRYEVAAELCSGLRVADVGCGSGYGSAILASACPQVVGIDLDSQTIELARNDFGDIEGLEFRVADAHDFLHDRLPDGFDAVVMLETLEHLEDIDDVLLSLGRQAENGLKLFVSVPNSRVLDERNPFHVTNFGFEQAVGTFAGFEDLRFLYQFIVEGSLIRGDDGDEATLTLADEGEREYANQFIALVNFEDRGSTMLSTAMRLAAEPVHHRYLRGLEQANEELRAANARLAREKLGTADSAAAAIVNRVRTLEGQLADARLELSDARLLEHKGWIDHLHRRIAENEQTIEEMRRTRVWQLGRRYWAVRDRVRSLVRHG